MDHLVKGSDYRQDDSFQLSLSPAGAECWSLSTNSNFSSWGNTYITEAVSTWHIGVSTTFHLLLSQIHLGMDILMDLLSWGNLVEKRSVTEKQPITLPLPLPRDDYHVPLHHLVPLVSPRTFSLGGWLGAMNLYLWGLGHHGFFPLGLPVLKLSKGVPKGI